MFDIEKELNLWRRRVEKSRRLSPEIMEELESHLLDSYEANKATMANEAAFRSAVDSLGESHVLGNEFGKIDPLISIENSMKNLITGSVIVISGLMAAMLEV
ncbi:permease prefix domain 1-containing protein [Puniceicoccaceae bacterium K14]|nr:permease prefix domain 1-containing protein [Puniceicoccaceae bacterium K14]